MSVIWSKRHAETYWTETRLTIRGPLFWRKSQRWSWGDGYIGASRWRWLGMTFVHRHKGLVHSGHNCQFGEKKAICRCGAFTMAVIINTQ
jgi:hypothetical protein